MRKCPICGTEMKDLLTSSYCPNEHLHNTTQWWYCPMDRDLKIGPEPGVWIAYGTIEEAREVKSRLSIDTLMWRIRGTKTGTYQIFGKEASFVQADFCEVLVNA